MSESCNTGLRLSASTRSIPRRSSPTSASWPRIGGTNILRDSPFDHKHHHALMFAFRVNGVNFWEEAPGCGHQKFVDGSLKVDFESDPHTPQRISLRHRSTGSPSRTPACRTPAHAALLIEDRTLTVTVDESAGGGRAAVALRVPGRSQGPEVTLTGSNYNGLGMRFRQDLDPLATHLIGGDEPDLERHEARRERGPLGRRHVRRAGQAGDGRRLRLAAKPGRQRPSFFSMKHPFAYLSATPGLDQKPLRYKTGDTFTLDYLIAVYPEIKPAEFLARRGERWAAGSPRPARP